MLEPVLNCHSTSPVSSSSAITSPVGLPVNSSPLAVPSMLAAFGMPVIGTFHLNSPVSGFIAEWYPTTSLGPGFTLRPATAVLGSPSCLNVYGTYFWIRGRSQELKYTSPVRGLNE